MLQLSRSSTEVRVCCRAAAMTLRTVLLSLQALLAAAEPDDPQDAVVAQQYKEHYEIFRRTALHWTSTFANGQFLCTGAALRPAAFKIEGRFHPLGSVI